MVLGPLEELTVGHNYLPHFKTHFVLTKREIYMCMWVYIYIHTHIIFSDTSLIEYTVFESVSSWKMFENFFKNNHILNKNMCREKTSFLFELENGAYAFFEEICTQKFKIIMIIFLVCFGNILYYSEADW